MIHDPALLERLDAFGAEPFDGEVFRATRRNLDPLAASTSGGRWAAKGLIPVLYTSLLREGALAEIAYHWSQLTPWPSRPAAIHRLGVSAERRLRLLRAELEELDVDLGQYETINYQRTQEIGAAVAFLGSRWPDRSFGAVELRKPRSLHRKPRVVEQARGPFKRRDRLADLGTRCRIP